MRAVRISLIVLGILVGLFVGADRVALVITEDEVAAKARDGLGLSEEPSVSIKGFPFLTQVMGQRLGRVTLGIDRFEAQVDGQSVTVRDLDIELSDTRLSGGSGAVAAQADGTGMIGYEALTESYGELIGSTDTGFGATFDYGGPGLLAVRLQASVQGLGIPGDFEVTGQPVLEGDQFRLNIVEEDVPDYIPGADAMVHSELGKERTLGGLPDGMSLDSIEPTPEGLRLGITGSDVNLAG